MMKSYKRWPAWAVMVAVTAALLGIGMLRAAEPRTADERVQSIASQLACPVCNGESVADSRAPSALQIKANIERLVTEGRLDDKAIISEIDGNYIEELTLVPGGSGFDALVWILPVVAAVGGAGGLAAAFARWRRQPAAGPPSDADRALVATALDRVHDR